MRRLGRTGHKDGNQDAIVLALRAVGASVTITSGGGYGLPDLLVGWMGETYLLEVKNRAGRGVKLSPAEEYFMQNWKGRPVVIVETCGDALRAIGIEVTK